MRKLFVVGFVSVVVLIAWLLFLNLDMKPILRTSDFRFRYLFLKPAWSLH